MKRMKRKLIKGLIYEVLWLKEEMEVQKSN